MTRVASRFAPSTTGPAHPGTLLAGLLCWLDARSQGARVLLRLEDLDPERCRPEYARAFVDDLAWLGLDWDAVVLQSEARARHEAALERLASAGLLYPCGCSRKAVRAAGEPAPDGGFRYPGTCRERTLPAGAWRGCGEPLRLRMEPGLLELRDESGVDLSLDPWAAFGDPVVVRRDGAVAYRLASVVDDAAEGVNRVVRGRDLALTTAPQVALQLRLPGPRRGAAPGCEPGHARRAAFRLRVGSCRQCRPRGALAGRISGPRFPVPSPVGRPPARC